MVCAASASSVAVARLIGKPITLMSRLMIGDSDVSGGCGSASAVTMIFPPEAVMGSIALSGIRPEVSQWMSAPPGATSRTPAGEVCVAKVEYRAGSLLRQRAWSPGCTVAITRRSASLANRTSADPIPPAAPPTTMVCPARARTRRCRPMYAVAAEWNAAATSAATAPSGSG